MSVTSKLGAQMVAAYYSASYSDESRYCSQVRNAEVSPDTHPYPALPPSGGKRLAVRLFVYQS